MNPIEFKEQTKVIGKPEGMTDEECSSLPIWTDGQFCISCWELSDEEIELLIKERKIFISVISGATQPPIAPMVGNPFVQKFEH